jgi:hypothetical protein
MTTTMQDATEATPPVELVKGYYTLDTKRQAELLAYFDELCEERAAKRGKWATV